MRLLPRRGMARAAIVAVYLVVVVVALILFFEFVMNRHVLPSNI